MSAPKKWTASPYSSVVGIAITEGDKLIAGVRGERAVAEERARPEALRHSTRRGRTPGRADRDRDR